jgi:hypothetical protein
MKNLKDSHIAFLYSLLGYAITIACLHVAMSQGLLFTKMTILPFLLLSLVGTAWFTPRVARAATKRSAMLYGMLAATIIGVSTAVLAFASSVIYQTLTGTPEAIKNLPMGLVWYALAGFIYCVPAILIAGGRAGAAIFDRK